MFSIKTAEKYQIMGVGAFVVLAEVCYNEDGYRDTNRILIKWRFLMKKLIKFCRDSMKMSGFDSIEMS